ncbi:MAG: hypothetical protein U9N61_12050 [Euryarchaeota archaeon]|nr:hypothetical protein [Euryarchaeota archaeon]
MPSYYKLGDAIEGERVVCQFRKPGKVKLISATHAHRAQEIALNHAYWVITKPLRSKRT